MIIRILGALVALFVLAFVVIWVLQGGVQDIEVAVGHYRNPLTYGSVYDWFFQIGSTTGETFKLPGTPSSYPTLSMPQQTSNASTSAGPTTYYQTGSNGNNGTQ